jgi:hypothetical protein
LAGVRHRRAQSLPGHPAASRAKINECVNR